MPNVPPSNNESSAAAMLPTFCYLGLGANLHQPLQQLQQAVVALAALEHCQLQHVSSLYGSKPMGPQDQPDYVNAVAALETRLPPHALLAHLQEVESRHGRTRGIRWGARTLDLDLLLYADDVIRTSDLTVPHPELANRNFVVIPLLDILPHLSEFDASTHDLGFMA